MEKEEFKMLVSRYLANELNEVESSRLQDLIANNPDYAKIFNANSKIWELTSNMNFEFDPDTTNQWHVLKNNLAHQNKQSKNASKPKVRKTVLFPTWYKWAASFALLFASVYSLFWFLGYQEYDNVVTSGSKKEVILPDGSIVMLNSHSSIMYPDSFEETRTIYFNGEGFFNITKDPNKPFIIEGDQSKTEILGTSFNLISGYDLPDEIVVVSGSVAYSSIDDRVEKVILKPGEKGVLNSKSLRVSQSQNENQNFLSWKTGKIIFVDAKLSKVKADLEKYFDLKFVFNNKEIFNCEFSAKFEKASLDEVLRTLAISLDITYTIKSERVIFNGKGCN